jgi:hypothetical protein
MMKDAFYTVPLFNKDILICPVHVISFCNDPEGFLVTGIFRPENENFLLSVVTKQKKKEVLGLLRSNNYIVLAEGRWSRIEFIGQSGEKYRPLLGEIKKPFIEVECFA